MTYPFHFLKNTNIKSIRSSLKLCLTFDVWRLTIWIELPNDEVSDTTGDDNSATVGLQLIHCGLNAIGIADEI